MSTNYNKLNPCIIAGGTYANDINYNNKNNSLVVYGNEYITQNLYIDGSLNLVGQDIQTNISNLISNTTNLYHGIDASNNSITYNNNSSLYFNNYWSVGSQNTFNSNAISNPILSNSISSGTGDGNSFFTFNLAISSWFGIGFVDSYSKSCNIVMDVRDGNINTKGYFVTSNGIISNGITLSSSVLNYLSNVTSDIQAQINSINNSTNHISYNSSTNSTTFSDNVTISGTLNGLSNSILGYLSNVSSDIQSQFTSLTSNVSTLNSNVGNITYSNNNLALGYQNVQCENLTCSSFYQYNLLSSLANIYNVRYQYTSPNYGLFICSLTTDNSRNETNQTKYVGCSFYVYFMPSKSLANIIFNDNNNFQIIASTTSPVITLLSNVQSPTNQFSLFSFQTC